MAGLKASQDTTGLKVAPSASKFAFGLISNGKETVDLVAAEKTERLFCHSTSATCCETPTTY
jgi:hypothetical protein